MKPPASTHTYPPPQQVSGQRKHTAWVSQLGRNLAGQLLLVFRPLLAHRAAAPRRNRNAKRTRAGLTGSKRVQLDAQVCERREAPDPIGDGASQVVFFKIPASTHMHPPPQQVSGQRKHTAWIRQHVRHLAGPLLPALRPLLERCEAAPPRTRHTISERVPESWVRSGCSLTHKDISAVGPPAPSGVVPFRLLPERSLHARACVSNRSGSEGSASTLRGSVSAVATQQEHCCLRSAHFSHQSQAVQLHHHEAGTQSERVPGCWVRSGCSQTHNCVSAVRLPIPSGMVPIRLLS